MTLRILFAVHGYKPAYRIGGPIVSVSSVAEALVRRGHRVTVFTTNSNQDQELDVPCDVPVQVDGVEVWYFRRDEPLKRWLPRLRYVTQSIGFLYAPAMRAALDRMVPDMDIVHTQMPYVYPTYAAAHAAFRFGKPLCYHQRGVFAPESLRYRGAKKRLYIRAIEYPIMSRASMLFALTPAEVASYRALGVTTPARVVPNGVHVDRYRITARQATSDRFGLPDDAQVVLFLSRVHPSKGAGRLLDAFLSAAARLPNVHLVLAGPDETGLEAEFRTRAQESDVAARVHFPGMVEGADKFDLLARADLFALPSNSEGLSIAMLEAMASGTALLLSPGCHYPDAEREGFGRTVDLAPASIAAALVEMLADRDGLVTSGARARMYARQHHDWEVITDQWVQAYEDVLASRVHGAVLTA